MFFGEIFSVCIVCIFCFIRVTILYQSVWLKLSIISSVKVVTCFKISHLCIKPSRLFHLNPKMGHFSNSLNLKISSVLKTHLCYQCQCHKCAADLCTQIYIYDNIS